MVNSIFIGVFKKRVAELREFADRNGYELFARLHLMGKETKESIRIEAYQCKR